MNERHGGIDLTYLAFGLCYNKLITLKRLHIYKFTSISKARLFYGLYIAFTEFRRNGFFCRSGVLSKFLLPDGLQCAFNAKGQHVPFHHRTFDMGSTLYRVGQKPDSF